MDWPLYADLLILIIVANAAPVLTSLLLGERLATPLDGGRTLGDGEPVLGASKTWRGVLSSWLFCALAAPLLGLPWSIGLVIGVFAMAGDLLSSFIKRRQRLSPGSSVPVLDQLPESLFPLLAVRAEFQLGLLGMLFVISVFGALNIMLTRLLKTAMR